MSLQFRRGTETDRLSIVPLEGEPIWQMNDNTLWVGDGSTAGGIAVSGAGGGNTFTNIIVTNTATVGSLATAGNIDGSEGAVASMTGFRAGWYGGTAGFAFKSDTTTGMFGYGNGDLRIRSSGTNVIQITTQTQFNQDILLNAVKLKINDVAYINNPGFNDIQFNVGDSAVRIVGDQGLIIGDGGGSSQIDVNQITGISGGPVNIATVLKVGDGTATGYVTSRGSYDLRLTTNDNTGPGAQVLLHDGQDGIFNVYSGAYSVMAANTLTNTLNSDQFNFQNGVGSNIAQFSTNGSTHYGNYHNFGNTDATAQINSQGTGNLVLCASSDNNNSGYVLLSSGESGDVELYGPGTRQIAVFNTGTVTINTRSGANTFTSTFGSTGTLTVPQLAATNTSTVALLTVGKNNSRVTFPGQTTYANSMLLANDNTSGPIIFTTKGASTNRSLMITRNADLVFHNGGQISSQSNGGIGISAMSTATVSVVSMSAGFQSIAARQVEGIRLSTYNGVDQWFTTMNTATGSWSFPGDITVTNTATAQSLVSTTTTVTGMMTLPVYTKAALGAITGAVGQIAIVSDSAGGSNPNGMMAFWDLTNARWSYVHDNNAV